MQLFIVGVKVPAETFIARKIEGLVRKGVHVTVYISSRTLAKPFSVPNVRVLYLPQTRGWRGLLSSLLLLIRRLVLQPAKTRLAWRVAQEHGQQRQEKITAFLKLLPFVGENPDIIHFEWNSAAIDYLPLFDFLRCPIVISCRGSQIQVAPHNPKRGALVNGLRITFDKATAVHCVSAAIRDEASRYGLDPDKVFVIRPAIEHTFFAPLIRETESSSCRLVTTGSLIWGKGYEYLLLALNVLKQRGCRLSLDIIGDGPERQRILYTIGDLGLESVVRLVGQRTPEQVKQILQCADVFVLASLSEGISNAVLEAMACGLPVVTTDCGGMREVITDGVEGFVVPVRDVEAMANALEVLVANSELRSEMGRKARARILDSFTLDRQVEQFLAMYAGLLKG